MHLNKKSILLKENNLIEIKKYFKLASSSPQLYKKMWAGAAKQIRSSEPITGNILRKPVFKLLNKPNLLPLSLSFKPVVNSSTSLPDVLSAKPGCRASQPLNRVNGKGAIFVEEEGYGTGTGTGEAEAED